MDKKTMFKLTYGLFVLTAKDGDRDNGCIINTMQEVASDPLTVSFAVNKGNFTHDMVMKTGKFNVSIINDNAKFDMFKQFGFSSGRDTDKFADIDYMKRADNGIYYIDNDTNAYISGTIINTVDLGSHTLFLASVDDAVILNDVASLTYAGYHDHVKVRPAKVVTPDGETLTAKEKPNGKIVWVCDICGYEYEGDELPEGFTCPICTHPAEYFHKEIR